MCNKCHDSGLLQFVKNGKVIPHVLLDCSCKETPVERYYPLTSADFDFQCSDSYRGYYFERYDGSDPAKLPPQPPEREPDVFKPRPISKDLEQIKIDLFQLKRRSHEHTKKPQKPKEYGDISV